jgi:subtilisin-like proprotein convertase family protein
MIARSLISLAAVIGFASTSIADTTVEAVGRVGAANISTGPWAGARAGEFVHLKYDVNDTPQTVPSPGHAAIYATRLPTFAMTMRGVSVGLNTAFVPATTLANNYPVSDALVLSDSGETAAHLSIPNLTNPAIELFEVHNAAGNAWNSENFVASRGVYNASLFESAQWSGFAGGLFDIQLDRIIFRDPAEATGSCCPGDGFCAVTSQGACPGTWTMGGACSPTLCPAAGACCVPEGGCVLRTAAACAATGGSIYQGDNTACGTPACPPAGACCFGGICLISIEAACTASEGTWLGQYATCSITPEFAHYYQHTPPQPGDQLLPTTDATFVSGGTDIPGITTSTLNITDTTVIQNLEVWVGMYHGRLMDVKLTLTGPNGTTLELLNRFGSTNNCTTMPIGPGRAMDGNFIFQDDAAQSISDYLSTVPTGTTARGGRYKPTACGGTLVSLSAPSPAGFGGIPLAGTWTLTITDAKSGVTGNLGVFALSINGGNPEPCTQGACCINSLCAIRGFAECTGTWSSAPTCTPDPCAVTTGACCQGSTCTAATQAACTGANTTFAGAGTVCNAFGTSNTSPCCLADYNHAGGVTVQDIFDFLAGYFTQNPQANINGVGGVTVQDIFDYLATYFAGC